MSQPTDIISLGHGSGGRLTHELVREVFRRHFGNPLLAAEGDAAVLPAGAGGLAVTTDAFVVTPLEFPGGDIGALAVHGSVNDLAVTGAVPQYLSAAFILEEGLPLALLNRIADSMGRAAAACGVSVVAGDTKVVERGHGDGVYIVTTGVGRMRPVAPAGPGAVHAGDAVLVTGPVGDHGATIAAVRSGMTLTELVSDTASLVPCVDALYQAGCTPRFLRDATRGGLVTVLAELCAQAPSVSVVLHEADLPVRAAVRTVCGMLGLDPLYLACEGRAVVVVPAGQARTALEALQSVPAGQDAAIVGELAARAPSPVVLTTRYGGTRLYDMLASEPLPRIC
jgi:hydrogenase expression/formation protein HypE